MSDDVRRNRFRIDLFHSAAERLNLVLQLHVPGDGQDHWLLLNASHSAPAQYRPDYLCTLVAVYERHSAVHQNESVLASILIGLALSHKVNVLWVNLLDLILTDPLQELINFVSHLLLILVDLLLLHNISE